MIFKRKKLTYLAFIFLISLFFATRLPTLLQKSFPYTYDQGRDFLKVEEIVRYKNPTFIGPTTGIMGLYHGAWWYYYLAIPYILTDGNPTAFAAWVFLTQLFSTLIFAYFLKKEFGELAAITFFALVAFSHYFVNMSSFVINSGFTFPFILLLLYSLYNLFKTKKAKFYFLTFLSAGFIWEAEYAFGIFLLPSLVLTLILTVNLKTLLKKKNLIFSFFGLIIPLLPRIAFEIKNNFIQTKTLLNFLFKPKLHNPKPLFISFKERLFQFKDFYLSIFPDIGKIILSLIFLFTTAIVFYKLNKVLKKGYKRRFLKAIFVILFLLFFLSGFYRDNFWANYYEGIQFFFIIILSTSLSFLFKFEKFEKVSLGILALILIFGSISTYQRLTTPFKPSGLYIPDYLVKKLYEENKGKKFCARVYTPPVIPYTWDYLFKYYSRKLNSPEAQKDFVDKKCYFIIEDESPGFEFRIKKWREENIPDNSKLIRKEYKYGVTIELREI